ncbi:hypothetical protein D3C73_1265320 [compost metagenome]
MILNIAADQCHLIIPDGHGVNPLWSLDQLGSDVVDRKQEQILFMGVVSRLLQSIDLQNHYGISMPHRNMKLTYFFI